ncbi:MAG TPA: DNA-processing protein DprA [Anaerolineales bacterium]|nr:DNA-processing protein DprA [Anaerolineales bacterium]
MSTLKPYALKPAEPEWPASLAERMGRNAPPALHMIGPVTLLAERRTALFCSATTPGDAILRAHDTARQLRDEGVSVISGFHSPIEKGCLKILLRGNQPIIVCPARSLEGMRVSPECRPAFDAGRLLFLSPFADLPRRVTKESALRRNEVVAALTDELVVAYARPGGAMEALLAEARRWGIPCSLLVGAGRSAN